jgi:hypothetical protein
MNGYGTIEKIYRPLGIAIIKSKKDESRIIVTPGAVRRGADGFDELTEGDEVEYRQFDGAVAGGVSIARDVWKKTP